MAYNPNARGDLKVNGVELDSAVSPAGSSVIGDDNNYSNFTPTSADTKGALEGIDSALGNLSGEFSDSVFRLNDNSDPTKQLAFQVSAIATATTRTWTVPNTDLNFSASSGGSFANSVLSNLAATSINTSLVAYTDGQLDIGSALVRWYALYGYRANLQEIYLTDIVAGPTDVASIIIDDGTIDAHLGINQQNPSNNSHYYGIALHSNSGRIGIYNDANGSIEIYQGPVSGIGPQPEGLYLGAGQNSTPGGEGGWIELSAGQGLNGANGGSVTVQSTPTLQGGNSGYVELRTGYTSAPGTGNTGQIKFITGVAVGDSGPIILETGLAGVTRGKIKLVDGSEGTAGYVWTSTDVDGSGAWSPAAASGANTALSNLLTTNINVPLIFASNYGIATNNKLLSVNSDDIFVKTGTVVNGISGDIAIATGTESGTGTRGNISLSAFQVDFIELNLRAATDINSSFWGGNISGFEFDSSIASGGLLALKTSDLATNNITGYILLLTGDNTSAATQQTGDIYINTGSQYHASSSGQTGGLQFGTGQHDGTGSSGGIGIQTGNTQSGMTGGVGLSSGSSLNNGSSGSTIIATGSAGTGVSGEIVLATGLATTRGRIRIVNGSEGTAGYVWTSIDVDGSGAWVASGANTALSNLTSPTSINQNLLPSSDGAKDLGTDSVKWNAVKSWEGNHEILVIKDYSGDDHDMAYFGSANGFNGFSAHVGLQVFAQRGGGADTYALMIGTAETMPGSIYIGSGNKTGLNVSGNLEFVTGSAASGTSGSILPKTGNTVSGNAGNFYVQTGDSVNGLSGSIQLLTGTSTNNSSEGIYLYTGYLPIGNPSVTGGMEMVTGEHQGAGDTGPLNIGTGSAYNNIASGNTGNVSIFTGNTWNSTSGNISLITGGSQAGGNTGNLSLITGATPGTRGTIEMIAAVINVNSTPIRGLPTTTPNLATDAVNVDYINTRVGHWKRYRVNNTYFTTAALTETKNLFTLAAGESIDEIIIKHELSFVGGGIATSTIEVGKTGTNNAYAASTSVFSAPSGTGFSRTRLDILESADNNTQVTITLTTTAGNVNATTQGAVDIYVKIVKSINISATATLS